MPSTRGDGSLLEGAPPARARAGHQAPTPSRPFHQTRSIMRNIITSGFVPVIGQAGCVGHLIKRRQVFEAYDVNDKSLGFFAQPEEAVTALLNAAPASADARDATGKGRHSRRPKVEMKTKVNRPLRAPPCQSGHSGTDGLKRESPALARARNALFLTARNGAESDAPP